jgi:hypothetical protein
MSQDAEAGPRTAFLGTRHRSGLSLKWLLPSKGEGEMFDHTTTVAFQGANKVEMTTEAGHAFVLERDLIQLIYRCPRLAIGTRLEFDHTLVDPKTGESAESLFEGGKLIKRTPYPNVQTRRSSARLTVSGELLLRDDRLFAVKGDSYVDEFPKAQLNASVSDGAVCSTLIYEGQMHITLRLSEDDFNAAFRPAFLSSGHWEANICARLSGFQLPSEMAFWEPGDTLHAVLEADRPIETALVSLSTMKVG